MNRVLIDTDVILDFFFDRHPFSEFATKIFSMCESKRIEGFVTAVIFSNTYYLLRQTAKHDRVIEKLMRLLAITDVLSIDRNVIYQALVSEFKDFEDALQSYSAVNDGSIQVIVTRNTRHYKKSKIGVLTPESFIKAFRLMPHEIR